MDATKHPMSYAKDTMYTCVGEDVKSGEEYNKRSAVHIMMQATMPTRQTTKTARSPKSYSTIIVLIAIMIHAVAKTKIVGKYSL